MPATWRKNDNFLNDEILLSVIGQEHLLSEPSPDIAGPVV